MPDPSWTPTLEAVGAIERTRTKDNLGSELGTFTADTRPTGDEVTALIADGVREVTTRLGSDLADCDADDIDDLRQRAGSLARIRTAMEIELSYFPEQVGSATSPYDKLKELWDEGITSLEKDVGAKCLGAEVEGGSGARPNANWPKETTDLGMNFVW